MDNDLDWHQLTEECVKFAQRLIQTPSMPGEEEDITNIIIEEMRLLDFDEFGIDPAGNVWGKMNGLNPSLGALVLNSHTDHVDPGDLSLWPHPPFAAEISKGRIFGRGACDIKGPLAVQIYSMAMLKRIGILPRRDIVFTGFVQEEVGGDGAKFWIENLDYPVDLFVLGEPSSNNLSLGHRGIYQIWVTFPGKSVHASVPGEGSNPNYSLASFLSRLQSMLPRLKPHPLLGKTTVAPTVIEVDTQSYNVTPAWTRVLLDFRTAVESPESLQAFIGEVAGEIPHNIHNELDDQKEAIFGFYISPEEPIVKTVRSAIHEGTGIEPQLISDKFATDGRFIASRGIPVLGYSPGEEILAHTSNESISIQMMNTSLKGHLNLLGTF